MLFIQSTSLTVRWGRVGGLFRFEIGSSFKVGNNPRLLRLPFLAMDSEMISDLELSGRSESVKKRPRRRGISIALKYAESAARRAASSDSPGRIGGRPTMLKVLSSKWPLPGRTVTNDAARTSGVART